MHAAWIQFDNGHTTGEHQGRGGEAHAKGGEGEVGLDAGGEGGGAARPEVVPAEGEQLQGARVEEHVLEVLPAALCELAVVQLHGTRDRRCAGTRQPGAGRALQGIRGALDIVLKYSQRTRRGQSVCCNLVCGCSEGTGAGVQPCF